MYGDLLMSTRPFEWIPFLRVKEGNPYKKANDYVRVGSVLREATSTGHERKLEPTKPHMLYLKRRGLDGEEKSADRR
jgi:hypothetical protein